MMENYKNGQYMNYSPTDHVAFCNHLRARETRRAGRMKKRPLAWRWRAFFGGGHRAAGAWRRGLGGGLVHFENLAGVQDVQRVQGALLRSEERRVGKECRSRWSPYH